MSLIRNNKSVWFSITLVVEDSLLAKFSSVSVISELVSETTCLSALDISLDNFTASEVFLPTSC